MEPTPKEHADAVAKRDKLVDHLMKEGYAEDKESADKIISGMSEMWFNTIPRGYHMGGRGYIEPDDGENGKKNGKNGNGNGNGNGGSTNGNGGGNGGGNAGGNGGGGNGGG